MPPNHTGSRRLSLCELKLFNKAQLTDWFLWLRRARVRECAGACVCLRAACTGVGFFFMCRENQTLDSFSGACTSAASSKCSPGPCN